MEVSLSVNPFLLKAFDRVCFVKNIESIYKGRVSGGFWECVLLVMTLVEGDSTLMMKPHVMNMEGVMM